MYRITYTGGDSGRQLFRGTGGRFESLNLQQSLQTSVDVGDSVHVSSPSPCSKTCKPQQTQVIQQDPSQKGFLLNSVQHGLYLFTCEISSVSSTYRILQKSDILNCNIKLGTSRFVHTLVLFQIRRIWMVRDPAVYIHVCVCVCV